MCCQFPNRRAFLGVGTWQLATQADADERILVRLSRYLDISIHDSPNGLGDRRFTKLQL